MSYARSIAPVGQHDVGQSREMAGFLRFRDAQAADQRSDGAAMAIARSACAGRDPHPPCFATGGAANARAVCEGVCLSEGSKVWDRSGRSRKVNGSDRVGVELLRVAESQSTATGRGVR